MITTVCGRQYVLVSSGMQLRKILKKATRHLLKERPYISIPLPLSSTARPNG